MLVKDGDKKARDAGWPQKGTIEFKNLSMKYRDFMDPSLKDLTISIESGMKIGIVGRTGAGKSTISSLIMRLYDIIEGKILINDNDIRSLNLKAFHQ